jgi:hypothetical protein
MTCRWIRKDDETLCLDGYPIQIKRRAPGEVYLFAVLLEGHERMVTATLGMAKMDAERLATELAEFTGDPA